MDEFCIVFNELNSFLGIAFSDVKEKVAIIKSNNATFPGLAGFFSFIEMEMSKGIHVYNGENNSAKKAPKEFKKYNSTSRNLLRMMWLLTFIRVTFEQLKNKPVKTKLSDIFSDAYDAAFGEKHAWLIRKGAKVAIMTSADRDNLLKVVIGSINE